MVLLLNSKSDKLLNGLHYERFVEKISSKSTNVDPANLPPTASATKFQLYRVYLEISKCKENYSMFPLE